MKRVSLMLVSAVCACACAQQIEFAKERKATVKRYRFVGNHREESMWSALYGAKSGKIYIGLCTHAEAAHFYEFDPATETMRHIVDLTKLHGERGEGINTNGKIHVRMGEDNEGNVSLNEDTGPECIDPSSYKGAFWYRYCPKADKVEVLGRISRHFGLLGMVMDPKYMRLYGLAEDGHLYMHDIAAKYTRDLGKVDDWDICRTIFADDEGNVYGSYPVARIWKYDPRKDEVIDLPNIRLECDNSVPPRTMSKPMIDRKVIWRVIEWDPVEKVAYGIIGGNSMLFRYDVHAGPEGKQKRKDRLHRSPHGPAVLERRERAADPVRHAHAHDRQRPAHLLRADGVGVVRLRGHVLGCPRRGGVPGEARRRLLPAGLLPDALRPEEEAARGARTDGHRRRLPLLRDGRRLHGAEGRPNLLRGGR